MSDLRSELFKITENGKPESHQSLIENLKLRYAHSIILMKSEISIDRYTCILFVFNISFDEEYIALAQKCPNTIFANTDFLRFLINHNYLIESNDNQKGNLIVYFEKDAIKHIGKIVNRDLVISKWGTGHLYQHNTFEVPESYGREVKYFLPLKREEVLNYFVEFAKLNGVSI